MQETHAFGRIDRGIEMSDAKKDWMHGHTEKGKSPLGLSSFELGHSSTLYGWESRNGSGASFASFVLPR